MLKHINLNRNLLAFGIPLSLFGILFLLIKSTLFSGSSALDFAISADLLITVPVVYFLLIRKTSIPKTTVVPMMILGLLIGSFLLPVENQTYIALFKIWVLPVIELSIFAFIIIKVRSTIKRFKRLKDSSHDFFTTLNSTCREILPAPVATLMASEIAVVYYGFLNWKKRTYQENEFTYHKNSGAPGLFGGIILVIGIETFVLHNLLADWSVIAAWILSILSIYTAFQILGFARALAARPITLDEKNLFLRYGIMNYATIPFNDIKNIEISGRDLDKEKFEKKLFLLGELESHNVILHLKNEHQLVGLYGIKSKFKTVGLYIDKPQEFREKLEAYMIAD
jgi:hypothetical protein